MIKKFLADEWRIIEEGFNPETNRFSESIFSLGNEHMGLRGFFEEQYSGDSLHGIYLAGVYYPDKTRVGWWKIGYPEFFAKVINSTNWIGINIEINDQTVDLAKISFKDFRRELNMKEGCLTRSFTMISDNNHETAFKFTRFVSMADPNLALVKVKVTPINHHAKIKFEPYLNGDVVNEDANYGEKFWEAITRESDSKVTSLTMATKKTDFLVTTAMSIELRSNGQIIPVTKTPNSREKYVSYTVDLEVEPGTTVELIKYIAVGTSRDYSRDELYEAIMTKLEEAVKLGDHHLYQQHCEVWEQKWAESDIIIKGDISAQQGIRYNIFQLNQTYSGKDPRLNIGPKGFTGEKYGGSTYWDTEAFCFPFYLYTNEEVARNLLLYRYYHLERAKENAQKLGCNGALYPMVTMDGQECHNEWEITFEEIHRNAAIAYAIYNYTNYTGNKDYLYNEGLEVLVEISRYWASRVTYHPKKDQYLILGVTGPNEYENNVNNNWYTNFMAAWTLEYTLDSLAELKVMDSRQYQNLKNRTHFEEIELIHWQNIYSKMYLPTSEELKIFIQNDGYLDKELLNVEDLDPNELPLNKHWSWDRILRSCFIKQADVIQGIYFFPERFDLETQKHNFDFYEPKTVHESSLSPSIYSIVASRIGYYEKAYQLYLRTARLDLDNYNDDTDDGIHLTSMAGTWATIVQGFAGVTITNGQLTFRPYIPEQWEEYSFKITFQDRRLKISINSEKMLVEQLSGEALTFYILDTEYQTTVNNPVTVKLNTQNKVKL